MRHYFWVVKNEYASVYYTSIGASILERRKSVQRHWGAEYHGLLGGIEKFIITGAKHFRIEVTWIMFDERQDNESGWY